MSSRPSTSGTRLERSTQKMARSPSTRVNIVDFDQIILDINYKGSASPTQTDIEAPFVSDSQLNVIIDCSRLRMLCFSKTLSLYKIKEFVRHVNVFIQKKRRKSIFSNDMPR